MPLFKPEYETYQDVKQTLYAWGRWVWFAALTVIYYGVFSTGTRKAVADHLPGWIPVRDAVARVGPLAALLVLGTLVSHVVTHVLEAHDRFYDRYIVRWRRRYDERVILARLLVPVHPQVAATARAFYQKSSREFMQKAYYHFVGDREPRIRHNLVVRFYERVTKYWLTQIIELAIVVLGVTVAVHGILTGLASWALVRRLAYVVLAFAITRLAARLALKAVRVATEDEIEDIHSGHLPELEAILSAMVP